jgi:hypothetical protein
MNLQKTNAITWRPVHSNNKPRWKVWRNAYHNAAFVSELQLQSKSFNLEYNAKVEQLIKNNMN